MANMNFEIIYEDNHLLAVNKEAGLLSQGDRSGNESLLDLLKDYIKKKYNKPGNVFLGLVHRIDKPVSGIMIFAKTSKAAERFHRQFKNSEIKKMYLAIVKNDMKNSHAIGQWQELNQYMKREKDVSIIIDSGDEWSVPVKIRYSPILINIKHSLLLIDLITGKKHQIRAQLAYTGSPIIGDWKYKSDEKMADMSICLHSFYISFIHPVKNVPMEIFSPVPERFRKIIEINETAISLIKKLIKI